MDNRQIAADFHAAANYVREHGWVMDVMGAHGGPRCMEGALCSVLGLPSHSTGSEELTVTEHYAVLDKATRRLAGVPEDRPIYEIDNWDGPQSWNDVRTRTADEVVDLLESLGTQYDIKALADEVPLSVEAPAEPVAQPA